MKEIGLLKIRFDVHMGFFFIIRVDVILIKCFFLDFSELYNLIF